MNGPASPGVVRERASAVCVHASRLLCVRLRDPATQVVRLFVPGGAIEAGESAAQAAARETLEETGYRVRIESVDGHVARYPYRWDGVLREIRTQFFRAVLIDPDAAPALVDDAPYHAGVVWIALDQVQAALGFHAEIFAAVARLLP
jgi:tRNA(adenine34) deaminase